MENTLIIKVGPTAKIALIMLVLLLAVSLFGFFASLFAIVINLDEFKMYSLVGPLLMGLSSAFFYRLYAWNTEGREEYSVENNVLYIQPRTKYLKFDKKEIELDDLVIVFENEEEERSKIALKNESKSLTSSIEVTCEDFENLKTFLKIE